MAVEVQVYRRADVQSLNAKEIKNRKFDTSRRLSSVGLNSKLETYKNYVSEASVFYQQMNLFELAVWSAFLPTVYSKEQGGWGMYSYDIPPEKVTEEIAIALSLNVFSDFQIWTPEIWQESKPTIIDPIVVGVVGAIPTRAKLENRPRSDNSYFAITRWGESLVPFEEIFQKVASTIRKKHSCGERMVRIGDTRWCMKCNANGGQIVNSSNLTTW